MKYRKCVATSAVVVAVAIALVSFYLGLSSKTSDTTHNTPPEVYDDAASSGPPLDQDDAGSIPDQDAADPTPDYANTELIQSTPTGTGQKFIEKFDAPYVVKEAESMNKSNNMDWWVSSGGYFYSQEDVGSTIVGDLPVMDPWHSAYASSNPRDTDGGYHPQNIFRLVQLSTWKNFQQEAYFKILGDNLSASLYRNGSNGLLFFNRYHDANNLYYVGIRVDGYATIKKKINGIYYTLTYEPLDVFSSPYDRVINPNLLPKQQWIGMRSTVETNPDYSVSIKLYIDKTRAGNWVLVAEAVDDGIQYGGPVFDEGHAGIRTDFMDVEFDDYSIRSL